MGKFYVLGFATIIVLGSAFSGVAQVPSESKVELREELKVFAPFIGTWEIDAEWNSGESLWSRVEYSIGMAGNFVEARTFTRDGDGEVYQRYLTIWRWDSESSKLTSHGFTYDGSYTGIDTNAKVVEGKSTLESSWAMGETQIDQFVQIIDDSQYAWKVWAKTEGDKSQLMDGVWKRVK